MGPKLTSRTGLGPIRLHVSVFLLFMTSPGPSLRRLNGLVITRKCVVSASKLRIFRQLRKNQPALHEFLERKRLILWRAKSENHAWFLSNYTFTRFYFPFQERIEKVYMYDFVRDIRGDQKRVNV